MEGESFIFSGQGTIGFGRRDIISVLLTKSVILNVNFSPCCAKIVFILMQDYSLLPQVLHRLQNKEKPIRTTFTLRFRSLKMIFECSIAMCDVGLGRAMVQCQKNPLRKPKLSINRAILAAHFSAVKFCIGFFCWIGFFWFCIGFFL